MPFRKVYKITKLDGASHEQAKTTKEGLWYFPISMCSSLWENSGVLINTLVSSVPACGNELETPSVTSTLFKFKNHKNMHTHKKKKKKKNKNVKLLQNMCYKVFDKHLLCNVNRYKRDIPSKHCGLEDLYKFTSNQGK